MANITLRYDSPMGWLGMVFESSLFHFQAKKAITDTPYEGDDVSPKPSRGPVKVNLLRYLDAIRYPHRSLVSIMKTIHF